jgi:hypothetical protein
MITKTGGIFQWQWILAYRSKPVAFHLSSIDLNAAWQVGSAGIK